VLNCFLFSSLGVFIALTVKSHRDMNSFNAFVIIPMSFVAGTFFSLERLPNYLQIAAKIIPLTYASGAIRDTFLSRGLELYQPLVLAGFGIVFYILAVRVVQKAVD
jgi:ABC-type multidrug transport system permease subunit